MFPSMCRFMAIRVRNPKQAYAFGGIRRHPSQLIHQRFFHRPTLSQEGYRTESTLEGWDRSTKRETRNSGFQLPRSSAPPRDQFVLDPNGAFIDGKSAFN